MATLITCSGTWQQDDVTGAVGCTGELQPVDNPPLSALDAHSTAALTSAAVLLLATAFAFKVIRRQLGV